MFTRRIVKFVLLGLFVATGDGTLLSKENQPKAKTPTADPLDDLPPAAVARLGTLRLRHREPVDAVAFTPDGKTLISSTSATSGGQEPRDGIFLWDPSTKSLQGVWKVPDGVGQFSLHPEGRLLALVSGGMNNVQLWDFRTGKRLHRFNDESEGNFLCAAVSPDGKEVAAIGAGTPLRIYDVKTGKLVRKFAGSKGSHSLQYTLDSKAIASIEDDGIHLWAADTGKEIWRVGNEPDGKRFDALTRSADGKIFAAANGKHEVVLLAPDSGKVLARWQAARDSIDCVAFSPDAALIASGSKDGKIRLWKVATGKVIWQINGHLSDVHSIAFSPDGKRLASGSQDQTVRLWNVAAGEEVLPAEGHQSFVESVAFSPDGGSVASAGFDGSVRLWQLSARKEVWASRFEDYFLAIAFSPDGKTIAAGSWHSHVRLHDAVTGKELREFHGHVGCVNGVAFTPDGKTLISSDGTACIWDFASGKESKQLKAHLFALSPDGKLLATKDGKFVYVYDVKTWKELHRFSFGDKFDRLDALAFDANGRMLAGGYANGLIRVWDARTGDEVRRFNGDGYPVSCLAFLPDSDALISGNNNALIRLWGISAAKEAYCFRGHRADINSLAVSPDGSLLATGSRDFTILIWDLAGPANPSAPQGAKLSEKELARCWESLASNEALAARRAIRSLAASPAASIAFLTQRLQRVASPDHARIKRLIADLDADNFAKRESASKELEKIGELAAPALRDAQRRNPSAELDVRLSKLLKAILHPLPTGSELQQYRAIEVLERAGTADAKQLLQKIAEGCPDATLTNKAKAALEYLAQRKENPR